MSAAVTTRATTISGLRAVRSAIHPKTGSKISRAAGQAATTRPRLPRLTPCRVVYRGRTGRSAPKPTHRMNSARRSGRIGPQRASHALDLGWAWAVMRAARTAGRAIVWAGGPALGAVPAGGPVSCGRAPQPRVPGCRAARLAGRAGARPQAPATRLAGQLAADLLDRPGGLRPDPGRGAVIGPLAAPGAADRGDPALRGRRPADPGGPSPRSLRA